MSILKLRSGANLAAWDKRSGDDLVLDLAMDVAEAVFAALECSKDPVQGNKIKSSSMAQYWLT